MRALWFLVAGCAGGTATPALTPAPAPEPAAAAPPAVERCGDATELRQALFGDLHVHTSASFDSYVLGNSRNDAAAAYRFAKGESVPLPPFDKDGQSLEGRTLQLSAPLDFAAVTDHAEYLGEVSLCTDETSAAYNLPGCLGLRTRGPIDRLLNLDLMFAVWGMGMAEDDPARPQLCGRPGVDCPSAADAVWNRLQAVTEAANDPCTFTALHGYEWSGTVGKAMLHRNVIFEGREVVARPVSAFEAKTAAGMLEQTEAACNAVDGCRFLAIPHNSNLSGGWQFETDGPRGLDAATAKRRAAYEPLVEMVQAKGASECRNGFARLGGAADEVCDWELSYPEPMCEPGQDPKKDGCIRECAPDDDGSEPCTAPTDFVRNALKAGLSYEARHGINPFELGFIASTDTHNGTPGATEEKGYAGSHGNMDDALAEQVARGLLANHPNPGRAGGGVGRREHPGVGVRGPRPAGDLRHERQPDDRALLRRRPRRGALRRPGHGGRRLRRRRSDGRGAHLHRRGAGLPRLGAARPRARRSGQSARAGADRQGLGRCRRRGPRAGVRHRRQRARRGHRRHCDLRDGGPGSRPALRGLERPRLRPRRSRRLLRPGPRDPIVSVERLDLPGATGRLLEAQRPVGLLRIPTCRRAPRSGPGPRRSGCARRERGLRRPRHPVPRGGLDGRSGAPARRAGRGLLPLVAVVARWRLGGLEARGRPAVGDGVPHLPEQLTAGWVSAAVPRRRT